MRTSLRSRLERLEAVLAPKFRTFVLWDADDGTIDEKIAELRAEKNLGPQDVVHTVRFLRDDEPEPEL